MVYYVLSCFEILHQHTLSCQVFGNLKLFHMDGIGQSLLVLVENDHFEAKLFRSENTSPWGSAKPK